MKEGLKSKTYRAIGKFSEPNSTGMKNKEETNKDTERGWLSDQSVLLRMPERETQFYETKEKKESKG